MAHSAEYKTKKFFKILTDELQFEHATKITSAKIQKLFENPAIGPFLTEFCETITRQNIINSEDDEIYAQLAEQGKVKNGRELQRSIDRVKKQNTECSRHKDQMSERIQKLKKKKERLQRDITRIEQMKRSQQQRAEDFDALARESLSRIREEREQSEASRTQVSQTLENLSGTFSKLCNIVESGDNNQYLFSQTSLKNLLQAEENYNAQLTSFVKKQFFEISESMHEELSGVGRPHEVCSIADGNLLIGETTDVRNKMAADIRRAETGYPWREKRHISAKAREAKEEASFSLLNQKLQNLQKSPRAASDDVLRSSLDKTMKKTSEVNEQIELVSRQKIPDLISHSTPLQTTYLLTGDYRRKQARQAYFVEKQARVISLLQCQRARLDLLWMLLDVEEAGHVKTGQQVPILLTQLQSVLSDTMEEIESFQRNEQTEQSSQPHSFIDERDKVAVDLHKILGQEAASTKGTTPLLHLFDNLKKAAEELRKKITESHADVTAHPNSEETVVNTLAAAMGRCENFLRSEGEDGGGDTGKVILTPESVAEMSSHLQEEFNRLTSLIRENTTEIDKKKSYLEYHKNAAFARTLWRDFTLRPNSLKQEVENFQNNVT